MAQITTHFATEIYRAMLPSATTGHLNADLTKAITTLAADDEAGRQWSKRHNYYGYTSYASLNDLPWRFPVFETLKSHLDKHAGAFADALNLDLADQPLTLDNLWVNLLPEGGVHTGHIHPHSVLSGTYYVAVPPGASALRFEDPRLGRMMARPPVKTRAQTAHNTFVYLKPKPGMVVLWESWLRHEVPLNMAEEDRLSVSFNYRWGE